MLQHSQYLIKNIFLLLAILTDCVQPVGMEDGSIPDNHITATSQFFFPTQNFGPDQARLNGPNAWSTHNLNQNQYLQVALNKKQYVIGVITQGFSDAWTTHYKVEFTEDGSKWEMVSNSTNGLPKVHFNSFL